MCNQIQCFNNKHFILGQAARNAIEKAFDEIEKYTCIQFSPWKQEEHYVKFIKDEG